MDTTQNLSWEKGHLSLPCTILACPRDRLLVNFAATLSTVSRTIRRYQQSKSHNDRPRTGRLRATTARNYAYLRAIVRRRRHVTARTVLAAEWQPPLNRVVSVSIFRRRYVVMSKIAQRQNEPLHFPIIIKVLMTLSLSTMLITTFFVLFQVTCSRWSEWPDR